MSKTLAHTHLTIGAIGFLIFVLTGQYMANVHEGLFGMADGPRMLMRTAHLYIMLASLANICIGAYATECKTSRIQWLISVIFLVAPFLMIAEFFFGSEDPNIPRPYAYYGLISLFAAGTLLVLQAIGRKLKN